MARPKFEIGKTRKGEFFFHLVGGNGEIQGAGEGYKTLHNARRGLRAFCRNAAKAARYPATLLGIPLPSPKRARTK